MADLRDDDLFLVNRNDDSATVQQSELMAELRDDDYMIVNREDVTYKITGGDLIDSIIDELTLTPVVTPSNPSIGDLLTVDPNVAGGKSPYSYTYQWKYRTSIVDPIQDYAGETASTYQTVSSDEGRFIACEVSVTDSRGSTATALSAFTAAVIKPATVVKPSIIAPADGAGEMVQAVSDEITVYDASALDYSGKLSTQTGTWAAGLGPENAFQEATAIAQAGGTEQSEYIKWDAEEFGLDTSNGNLVVWVTQGDGTSANSMTVEVVGTTGLTGSHAGQATEPGKPVENVGILKELYIRPFLGGSPPALISVTYKGNKLVDGAVNPKLTLASDKDLTVFQPFDDVEQDSGYTPQTSVITGQSQGPATTIPSTGGTFYENSGYTMNDFINTAPGEPITGDYYFYSNTSVVLNYANAQPGQVIDFYFHMDGPEAVTTKITTSGEISDGGVAAENVSPPTDSNEYPGLVAPVSKTGPDALAWLEDENTSKKKRVRVTLNSTAGSIQFDPSVGYMYCFGRSLYGGSNIELTFADDKDLANFRVGDVVVNSNVNAAKIVLSDCSVSQLYLEDESSFTEANTDPVKLAAKWSEQNYYNDNLNDPNKGTPNKGVYINNETTQWLEFSFSGGFAGEAISFIAGTPNSGGLSNNGYIYVSGDIQQDGSLQRITSKGDTGNTLPKTLVTLNLSQPEGTFRIRKPTNTETQNAFGHGATNFSIYYITFDAPSTVSAIGPGNTITVDSGTWNLGDVVTGPDTTPATGTVSSTDPATNTMTLSVSDETYPKRWITNAGKFVKGEETPSQDAAPEVSGVIDVTPETDEITKYAQSFTQAATAVGINGEGYYDTWENILAVLFDGLDTTQANIKAVAAGAPFGLSMDISETTLTGNRLVIEQNATNMDAAGADVAIDGVNKGKISGGTKTNYFNIAVDGVKNVRIVTAYNAANDGAYFSLYRIGIEVNDGDSYDDIQWIINTNQTSYPELTLAGSKDLDLINLGDEIRQDSGYAPTTSAITNVDPYAVSNVKAYYSAVRPTNLAQALQGTEFDLTRANVNTVENSHYVALVCEPGCPTSGPVFKTDQGPIFDMKWSNDCGNFDENGNRLDAANNPPSGPSSTTEVLFSDGGTTGYIVNIQAAYTLIKTIALGTMPVVSDAALGEEATLTLTDDTDLANFRIGDTVQRPQANSPVFFAVGEPEGAPAPGIKFTIYDTATVDMTSTSQQSVGLDNNRPSGYSFKHILFDLLTIDGDFTVGFDTTGWTIASSVDGETWVSEGVFSPGSSGVSVRSVMVNNPSARYLAVGAAMMGNDWNGVDNATITFNQELVDTWADGSFEPSALPTTSDVKVIEIDLDALTMTVDGGTWVNDQIINGPTTTPATGVVRTIDGVNNIISLSFSDEAYPKRWIQKAGKFVFGPTIQVPSNLKLYSSDFQSDPEGTLAHTQSDWQITLKTDVSYSSPVSQSLNDSDDLTVWEPSNLEEGTAYRCRVRHKSNNVVSEWSDDSTFKTAEDQGPSLVNKPGQLFGLKGSDSALSLPAQPPVKLINAVAAQQQLIMGVGVDGRVYKGENVNLYPDLVWSLFGEYAEQKAEAFTTVYSNKIQDGKPWLVLNNDGTTAVWSGMTQPPIDADDKVSNIIAMGCVPNYIGVTTEKGENFLYASNTNLYFGSKALTENAWVEAEITLPAGEKVVKICGMANNEGLNYMSTNLAILSDQNKLYTVITKDLGFNSGPPKAGTNDNPFLWLEDVKDINPLDRSDILGGFSVVKNDGTLWAGFFNSRTSEINALPQNLSWGQIGTDTDWITPIYSMPSNSRYWAAIKSDGSIYYGGPKSLSYQKLNYGAANEVAIRSFGSLPDVQQFQGELLLFILPDA